MQPSASAPRSDGRTRNVQACSRSCLLRSFIDDTLFRFYRVSCPARLVDYLRAARQLRSREVHYLQGMPKSRQGEEREAMNEDILNQIPWKRWNSQPWLRDRSIFLSKHGSHAYSLNRPTSDIDVKGVAVPPKEYFHGFLNRFDEADNNKGGGAIQPKRPDEIDAVIFDIRKFCNLAADCNPNIIEVLFTAERHWLKTTPQHMMLVDGRMLFISKKARYTFSGYAHSQLKRIEGHYRWMRNPPKAAPVRADFGLKEHGSDMPKDQRDAIESLIKKQIEAWDIDWEPLDEATKVALKAQLTNAFTEMRIATSEEFWTAAARHIGVGDNMLEILAAERRFKSKMEEWRQYQHWKAHRNPDRHALEEKWGYDTKHGMHLVRLMRMAKEILKDGTVLIERPDRDELLAIRDGAWPYEDLIAWAKVQEEEIDSLYKTSPLPREPNRTAIDALCMKIVESML